MTRDRATVAPDLLRERSLVETFVDLAGTLVGTFDADDFLAMLCERAADLLDARAVGVLVEAGDELRLSAASTPVAADLDLFELQAREGPCFDAYASGEQVVTTDLSLDRDRWPGFAPRAIEAGFASVYAFPLRLRDDRIGGMNLFRTARGALDQHDVHVGQALADLATIGLLSQLRLSEAETRAAQLQSALDSRVLIEQAKGALAAREGTTPQEAFERLRRHARRHQRTIRSLCQDVIEGRLTPG